MAYALFIPHLFLLYIAALLSPLPIDIDIHEYWRTGSSDSIHLVREQVDDIDAITDLDRRNLRPRLSPSIDIATMRSPSVCRPAVLLLIAAPLLSCLPAVLADERATGTYPPPPPSRPSDIFSGLRAKREAKAYDNPYDWSGSMLTVRPLSQGPGGAD